MNWWLVVLTGLTTGGLSCLAMQGGLLTGLIANQEKRSHYAKASWDTVGLFLGSKLVTHTILGFLLGTLGSVLTLSLPVRLGFQLAAAGFMIATAMNLLEVHPLFRYIVFQPPKFIQKWIRSSAKSQAYFAPVVLGALTIFIPCGVTQAMEVVAISTGSGWLGAATMFGFVLGTSPLFAVVGVATAKLSEWWQQRFLKAAAVALLVMALLSVNGVLTVVDAPVHLGKVKAVIASWRAVPYCSADGLVAVVDGVQPVTIKIRNEGYKPNHFKVRQGMPVQLTLETDGVYTCAAAFTFKKFKIFTQLKPIDERTFRFTPEEKGSFSFACSMGMYTGVMEVI